MSVHFRRGNLLAVFELLGEFRYVIANGALLFVPSLALMGYTRTADVCMTSALCTSNATPWGVVTAIFLYDGPLNLTTFLVFASMFVSLNMWESSHEWRRRSFCLLVSSFVAAVLANYIWMIVTPNSTSGQVLVVHASYGQSGVVYAVFGSLVAAFLTLGFPRGHAPTEIRTHFSSNTNMLVSSGSILSFCILVLLGASSPELVFGSERLFNVMVHELAFVIGFGLSLPVYLAGRLRL